MNLARIGATATKIACDLRDKGFTQAQIIATCRTAAELVVQEMVTDQLIENLKNSGKPQQPAAVEPKDDTVH